MESPIEKYEALLPISYLEYITGSQGFSDYIDAEFGYVHVWNVEDLVESWNLLNIPDRLSDFWFPIGSNGGDEILAIKLSSPTKALYFVPFIGQSDKSAKNAELYWNSFDDLWDVIKSRS